MPHLLKLLYFSLIVQLCHAQAPIKNDEIVQKIKSFSDTETKQKEQWESLLQYRKDRKMLSEEIGNLTKSLKSISENGENTLQESNLDALSEEIPYATLPQVSERYAAIKQLRDSILTQQNALNSSIETSEERLEKIPDEIIKVQSELTTLNASREPTDEISALTNKELIAKHEESLQKLKLEQDYIEKELPVLKKNLIVREKDSENITKLYNVWADKLSEANKNTAQNIKDEIAGFSAPLSKESPAKELATETEKLADTLLTVNNIKAQHEDIQNEITELEQTHQLINEQEQYAKERIELLNKAKLPIDSETGTLLRKQRSELPTEKTLQSRINAVFQESTTNDLILLKQRAHLKSLDKLDPEDFWNSLSPSQRDEITVPQVTILIASSRQLHEIIIKERQELSESYRTLVDLLQSTSANSKTYSTYIDSKLLWIVSHPRLSKQSFVEEAKSLKIVYGREGLLSFFNSLKSDYHQNTVTWILFALLFTALIATRKKLKYWADLAHKEASLARCNSFKPTLAGLLFGILLASPIPVLLWFLSWRSPSEQPLHAGLQIGSIAFIILALTWRLSRKNGFFEVNNIMTEGHLRLFRKTALKLLYIFPAILITAAALTKVNAGLTQGRLFNMLTLIILASAMHFILLPKKRILSGKKPPGFLSYFVYFVAVIFPLALVIAAGIGYYISMLTLRDQLIYTLRTVLIILFITALLKRWLLVARRRALMDSIKISSEDSDSPLTEMEKKQEIQETVTKVSEQSSQLIKLLAAVVIAFSLITIWSKTLPALSVIDDVKLWSTTTTESSTPNPDDSTGSSETSTSTSSLSLINSDEESSSESDNGSNTMVTYITLQDLLVTITLSILTYLAAVNIPSLLQITIFSHLKLKHGTAFTITTAIRYIIIFIGIIWAFGSIGVTWNKIQWLAAAITLGIGFGLQEIFANFVAGIILLFERPIRIGDFITVSEINGKVTKIQMRATTILQINNRELIVPNKEFITGQLINWTLSDNVIRAEVTVGIAYGSDTDLATELLLECAGNNKRILKTPQPDVNFIAFGASSLDFMIKVYISSVDDMVPVKSEMHYAIDKAFREAGIEISFPQQDIHIRSIEAGFPKESDAVAPEPSQEPTADSASKTDPNPA